jgi:hypothetical protein
VSEAVDMIKLVKELPNRPRGRACIVLTHDYAGQKDWAMELAKQTGSGHVDLLDIFHDKGDLAEEISSLNAPRLFSLLQTICEKSVLIVSGMEFLKATWGAQHNILEEFAMHVETWSKSPAILFVLQFDTAIVKRKFTRYPQYLFIVDQKETLKL